MKHTKRVTILIVVLFILTQFIGLTVIYNYMQTQEVEKTITVIEDGKEIQIFLGEIYLQFYAVKIDDT